ncbi:MAG: hypothetical protein E7553_06635 [Ruminococcaceae bacterium]|nr:hypothetical protein [Oscillospiraceae bacterium]
MYIAIAQELQNGNITAQEVVANAVQTIGNAQETDATPQNPSAPHLDTAVQTAYTEHTGLSPSMLAELTEAFMAGVEGRRYVPKNVEQSFFSESEKSGDAIADEYITGGRNPNGKKADIHAQKYYEFIRKTESDIQKIARVSKLSSKTIRQIKKYLFFEAHNLGESGTTRFAPDYMIAESWRRLMLGKPLAHDLTLLKHEALERELVLKGMSQREAHIKASGKYNYQKEAEEYYGAIKKYSD